MSWLIPRTIVLVSVLLAGCERNEPAWNKLPSSPEITYTASIKTYGSEYADKPFDLHVNSNISPGNENIILRANQCKNVNILPRKDYIYIFYDELILSGYSSNQFDISLPRPFLCDIRNKFCSELLENAKKKKELLSVVCSFK